MSQEPCTVWLATITWGLAGHEVVGVFSSYELAHAALAQSQIKSKGYGSYIRSIELDKYPLTA